VLGPVSGKSEQFNTRLDPDDAAAVKEYADEHGVTKSEATRRFIRAGLEAVDEDDDEDDDAETEKKPMPDGGYVTQTEFRRAIGGLNVGLIVAAVYLGASTSGLLGRRATVAGGVLALVVLVASFVVGAGGRR
jgi:hypothetical protein